jgi:hypothetical protein
MKLSTCVILVLILSSCDFRVDLNKELEQDISSKLTGWKLNNEVKINEEQDVLEIEIEYKKGNVQDSVSFYLDAESNNMVLTMLSVSFLKEFSQYNEIQCSISFEGYPNKSEIKLTNQKISENRKIFEQVPIFYDFVEYAFINMKYVGVMQATQTIKFLRENSSEFDYEGSFWDLLYGCAISCGQNDKYIYHAKSFIWFTGVCNNPEFIQEGDIFPEYLLYYFNECGYDESLLGMIKSDSIIKYLKEH